MKRVFVLTAAMIALVAAVLVARNLATEQPLEQLSAVHDENGSTTYKGSWLFPRGGPYVLGFQCDTRCELRVDGKLVARGRGLVQKRHVFLANTVRVDFVVFHAEVNQLSRLVWHPPGRRGPPEYVPPSSLSADGPQEATFSNPGASIGDGVSAVLIVFILLGWITAILWRHVRSVNGSVWLEVGAVFAIALAVRLIGLGDAGQTWDEDVNWSAGRNYITNLLNLDFRSESWIWNLEHPPLLKYVAGIGAQFSDGYGPARALSALMMASACALLVPIGHRLIDSQVQHAEAKHPVGLYAGLLAALSPHLIGHGQIVGHESAMALWWMAGLWAALAVWPSSHHRPSQSGAAGCEPPIDLGWRLAGLGIIVGAAVASRFPNGTIAVFATALVLFRAPANRRLETFFKLSFTVVAALITVVVLWPRLWSSPISHLSEAWAILSKPHSPEPYLGTITNRPARHYFLVYLVATAPLGLLLASTWGAVVASRKRLRVAALLFAWLLVPMVVSFSPVRQDGVRYIIPSLFALAMLAAFGLAHIGSVAERLLSRGKAEAARLADKPLGPGSRVPVAVVAVYMAVVGWNVRPYFIDYYGEHVGGAERVAEKKLFETAWWGEGLDRALEFLAREAAPGARVFKACIVPSHLAWMRGDLWATEVRSAAAADWILWYAPNATRCAIPAGFELAFEVSASGAPLARVYRRTL